MGDPERIADADDNGRMLQHRCKDRVGEHLFITDQYCSTLVVDSEDARSVETKWDAIKAEGSPHRERNRHALIECGGLGSDNQHRVVHRGTSRIDLTTLSAPMTVKLEIHILK